MARVSVSAGGHTVSSGKKQGVVIASAQPASPLLAVCFICPVQEPRPWNDNTYSKMALPTSNDSIMITPHRVI